MALENLSENLSDLLQTGVVKTKEIIDAGVAKTRELTEIGKLKLDNATQQEAIKRAYVEIGKLYFAERGMDPEPPYTALCEKIAAAKGRIDYNLERIDDLRAAGAPADAEVEEVPAEPEVVPGEDCPCCQDAAPAEDAPAADVPAAETPIEETPAVDTPEEDKPQQ